MTCWTQPVRFKQWKTCHRQAVVHIGCCQMLLAAAVKQPAASVHAILPQGQWQDCEAGA